MTAAVQLVTAAVQLVTANQSMLLGFILTYGLQFLRLVLESLIDCDSLKVSLYPSYTGWLAVNHNFRIDIPSQKISSTTEYCLRLTPEHCHSIYGRSQ